MKKWTNLILASLLAFVFSCSESDLKLSTKNDTSLSSISTKQAELLIEDIQTTFDKKEVNVQKIIGIDVIDDNITIVEYQYNGSKKAKIALSNLPSPNAKVDAAAAGTYRVWCTGPCDCGTEGVPGYGNESYIQCKCTDCTMHIEISPGYPNNKTNNKYRIDLQQIVDNSFSETFGRKASKVIIDKVEVDKHEGSNIFTLHYSEGSSKSTVLLVTNYVFPNSMQQAPKDFTVDCTGSCDCRERFFPGTGAIECTCAPCKMDVKEVQPPKP